MVKPPSKARQLIYSFSHSNIFQETRPVEQYNGQTYRNHPTSCALLRLLHHVTLLVKNTGNLLLFDALQLLRGILELRAPSANFYEKRAYFGSFHHNLYSLADGTKSLPGRMG